MELNQLITINEMAVFMVKRKNINNIVCEKLVLKNAKLFRTNTSVQIPCCTKHILPKTMEKLIFDIYKLWSRSHELEPLCLVSSYVFYLEISADLCREGERSIAIFYTFKFYLILWRIFSLNQINCKLQWSHWDTDFPDFTVTSYKRKTSSSSNRDLFETISGKFTISFNLSSKLCNSI